MQYEASSMHTHLYLKTAMPSNCQNFRRGAVSEAGSHFLESLSVREKRRPCFSLSVRVGEKRKDRLQMR